MQTFVDTDILNFIFSQYNIFSKFIHGFAYVVNYFNYISP